MNFQNVKIVILYGSQTGNAQDVAERIWRESKKYYFNASVKCMDDYEIVNLVREQCVIFVCATTGQGEEPDNMKNFWKFLLRKSLPLNSLDSLNYAVLGLGDSSYIKFNFAAKRLHKRIQQLGGNAVVPLGLGDDQHDLGYDAVVDPWLDQLWSKLSLLYPLPSDIKPNENYNVLSPRWNVSIRLLSSIQQEQLRRTPEEKGRAQEELDKTQEELNRTNDGLSRSSTQKPLGESQEQLSKTQEKLHDNQEQHNETQEQNSKTQEQFKTQENLSSTQELLSTTEEETSIYYVKRNPKEFLVKVIENKRTTSPDHFQDVRLIKLKTNGQEYKPGDIVVLRPKNSDAMIKEFQNILQMNGVDIHPKTLFKVSEKLPDMPVPTPLTQEVTFQDLCREYFDLTAVPRRNIFSILAQITDSELEREKCLEFTTAEGQQDLYNYCNRPKRYITEVLQDFPHATKNLTPELLFEILPSMKPREFSIASSFKAHTGEIHILVAVVRYKTKLKKERLGLISNYLASLNPGESFSAWLRNGSFRFPDNKDDPVIMIGPGTGLASFRNYINDRDASGTASSENLILFFGCRGKNKDFHCKDELSQFHKEGKLNLICAFSRDQEFKSYVQHKIIENKELIWKLLNTGRAHIYVAGNSKNMPQQVRDAFKDVCVDCGGFSNEEADGFIEKMERSNRYQTETWS